MNLKHFRHLLAAAMAVLLVTATRMPAQNPPIPAGANQARVKQLLDQVRLTEAWLDKATSILIKGEGVWTSPEGTTAEVLQRELDARRITHFPGQGLGIRLFAEKLPRIEERVEVAWDPRRVVRLNEKPGIYRVRSQWDGERALFMQSSLTDQRDSVMLDQTAHTFAASMLMIDLNFGKTDMRKTWWTPSISPQQKNQFYASFSQYRYLRKDNIDGRPHQVIGLPGVEWWIDDETKRLSKITAHQDVAASAQAKAQIPEKRRAYLRSNNVPVNTEQEEQAFFTKLAKESPQEMAQVQAGIRNHLIAAGLVKRILISEFQNKDWKEVAPGFWFPMTQLASYYPLATDPSETPFLHREIKFTKVQINKPLPDDLFTIEIKEGTPVRDLGHDPVLAYAYKKNMTKEEMDNIIAKTVQYDIQLKAQDEKRKNLLGKTPPKLSARYWVNTDPIDLADLGGKGVIIYFWADYIPECKKDFGMLEEIHSLYSQYFQVIAVHTPIPIYRSFFELNVPILVDNSAVEAAPGTVGDTGFAYGIHRLPYAYLIAPNGKVDSHGQMKDVYQRVMGAMQNRPTRANAPKRPQPRQAAPRPTQPSARRPQPKQPRNLPPNVSQKPPTPTSIPVLVEPNP